MAETKIGGRDIRDGSVTSVDLDLSLAPTMAVGAGTNFIVLDSGDNLVKKIALSVLETYFNTKYNTWTQLTGTVSGFVPTQGASSVRHFLNGNAAWSTFGTAANTIAEGNDSRINNGQTAFSWGNHAGKYRPISYVPSWSEITPKPTTLAGFGITDAVEKFNLGGNDYVKSVVLLHNLTDEGQFFSGELNIRRFNNLYPTTKVEVISGKPWTLNNPIGNQRITNPQGEVRLVTCMYGGKKWLGVVVFIGDALADVECIGSYSTKPIRVGYYQTNTATVLNTEINNSITTVVLGGSGDDFGGQISVPGGNSTNWNSAFGWGNHAGLYPTYAGVGATGTWPININGSAPWTGITGKEEWLGSASLVGTHIDANSWKNSGFYENGGGGSNWPSASWYNSINVRHSNQNNYHGFQIAMSFYDNNLWFRSYQGNGTFQSWAYAISSQNIASQEVNRARYVYNNGAYSGGGWVEASDLGVRYANSAGSAPNGSNQNSQYLVSAGDGNGLKFWASDDYKISMGWGSLYQYGPVTDYSIKMQMNAASPDRGFTWGREGNPPIAALNSTSGNFQINGFMRANRYYSDDKYYSLAGTDDNDSFGNPWYGMGRKNGNIVNFNGWGGIAFRTGGSNTTIDTSGNFSTPGDVIAFSTSDKRFKDNIQRILNPIDKIMLIGGYTFDWNSKQDVHSGKDVGVIAQEIEAVIPEIVTTRDNGYKAVKYDKLVALLIEGIKEQQLEIEKLKKLTKNLN